MRTTKGNYLPTNKHSSPDTSAIVCLRAARDLSAALFTHHMLVQYQTKTVVFSSLIKRYDTAQRERRCCFLCDRLMKTVSHWQRLFKCCHCILSQGATCQRGCLLANEAETLKTEYWVSWFLRIANHFTKKSFHYRKCENGVISCYRVSSESGSPCKKKKKAFLIYLR